MMNEPDYEEAPTFEIGDIIAILKRRLWHIIIPIVLLSPVAVAAALLWPPTYRSEATILIEQPDVPPELVASTVTGYAAERVQVIKQRVLTTEKLVSLINKHDLFAEARERGSIHPVVEAMRGRVAVELITSGGRGSAAIAFSVAFEDASPTVAQQVASDLASLFLSENLRWRREKASETSEFLADEAERLEGEIVELEQSIGALKREHSGSLPEQQSYNLDLIRRAEGDLRELRQREMAIKDRLNLERELVQMGSHPVNGEAASTPQARLEAQREKLRMLTIRYTPQHPDVLAARREVAALEQIVAQDAQPSQEREVSELRAERDRVQEDLAASAEQRSEHDPAVVELRNELADIEAALAKAELPQNPDSEATSASATGSQLWRLQESARIELAAIDRQRETIQDAITRYEQRVANTPRVEAELRQLERAYADAKAQYQNIKAKQITARLGESLEAERKSERFSLIEPATVPNQPIKPKRMMILVAGMFLAVGSGFGLALLVEILDSSVHGPRAVMRLTGAAPLAVVPYVKTRREVRFAWGRRCALAGCSVAVVVGGAALLHYRVMPLDDLTARIEQRLEKNLPAF